MSIQRKDGPWGWLVVGAATLSQVILGGICLSGGLFFLIFRESLNTSGIETSWLVSLPITLWFLASPIGSVICNRYGQRTCAFGGGLLAATGICLSFFATNVTFLFFSYGILSGLGIGLNFTGCVVSVNSYFDRYRTLATGIISIGHNIGLILFSMLIPYLNSNYGWRGMFLILGGVTLHMCAFATVMQPVWDGSKERNPSKKKTLNVSMLKKSSFLFFCCHCFMVNFANGAYFLHLPAYAMEIDMTKSDVSMILTIYSICNIVGKVFFSTVGQLKRMDVTIMYTGALFMCGVGMALTPVLLSQSGMTSLAGLVGFMYCVNGALLMAVIFRIVGEERFAEGVGISCLLKAMGNLLGSPAGGILYNLSQNYFIPFLASGFIMIFSCLLMVVPIVYHIRKDRRLTTTGVLMEAKQTTCIDKDILFQTKALIGTPSEKQANVNSKS